jgi:nucleoside-diphosphate-sugar epimerase
MNMEQSIAVTGGRGFVGGHLARVFAASGRRVLSLDAAEANDIRGDRSGISSLVMDITKSLPDLSDFRNCTLIHAAAKMKGNSDLLWSVNVEGTRNVLDWAVRHQVSQVIFFSTGGVYGYREFECKESDPIEPIGVYGHTKWLGEQLCRMYASVYSLPVTVLRLYFPFGPLQKSGIFGFVFEAIRKGTALTVYRDGAPRFKPTHVDDVAAACKAAMVSAESVEPGYRVYNLCGDEPLSFVDIVRIYERRLSRKALQIQSPENQGNLLADNTRLKQIGWCPTHSIRELENLSFP